MRLDPATSTYNAQLNYRFNPAVLPKDPVPVLALCNALASGDKMAMATLDGQVLAYRFRSLQLGELAGRGRLPSMRRAACRDPRTCRGFLSAADSVRARGSGLDGLRREASPWRGRSNHLGWGNSSVRP